MLIFPRDKPRKIILIPAEMPFSWFQKLHGRLGGKYYIKLDGIDDGVFYNEAFESLPKNPGGMVLQEAGTALITTTILQVSSSKLTGVGPSSIIEGSGALSFMLEHGNGAAVGSEDIEICHITFQGEGSDTDWAIYMGANAGVYNDRFNVHDCRFYDITGPNQVIYALNTRDCRIADNYFENIFNGPVVGVQGGRIIVTRNIVRRPRDAALTVGAGYATAPYEIIISHNIVDGEGEAFSGGIEVLGSSTASDYADLVSIVGNIVKNIELSGISLHKFAGTEGVQSAAITGNALNECDRFGIYIQRSNCVSISGNVVKGSGWSGMWIEESSFLTISSNASMNNGQVGGALYSGIRLASGNHITIGDNVLADDQGAPTQQYGLFIDGPGTVSDVGVAGNEFYGNATAPVGSNQPGEPKERGHNLGYPDPAARVYRSSAQDIVNATWASISFDNARYDTGGIWAIGSPTRLTCQTAGKYSIKGHFLWAANVTGQREARILLNGAISIGLDIKDAVTGGEPTSMLVCTDYDLALGDFLELQGWQSSGLAPPGLAVISAGNSTPEFMMERITG